MLIIKEGCYKGTRIILGNDKPLAIEQCKSMLRVIGFQEIQIPIIHPTSTFESKVGEENNNLMYTFKDRGDRNICLAPEYTAVVQNLAKTTFKHHKNLKLFYVAECFRGEKPQAGRYRQFTQLGVEILNPEGDKDKLIDMLVETAIDLIRTLLDDKLEEVSLVANKDVTRGLDYYEEGKGFEITCEALGSSKQVVGGGFYENGVGFAIGVDRVLSIKE